MELFSFGKVSQMLRKKRQRLGLKQKKVADAADLSPSQVNRIEKKTVNPSYKAVYQLWRALESMEEREAKKAEDLMNQPVLWADRSDTLEEAARKMRENDFSQLPVRAVEDGRTDVCVGRITERRILEAGNPDLRVEEAMGPEFLQVTEKTRLNIVKEMLKEDPAVLVKEEGKGGEIVGVITKSNLI